MATYRILLATLVATLSGACGMATLEDPPDMPDAGVIEHPDAMPRADAGPTHAHAAEINAYIGSIEALVADPAKVEEGPPSEPEREGDYSCTTHNLAETRQFDKIVAFAANSESLWSGAIVRGDSLYTGAFTQIVLDRAPLTFSVSLENLAGRKSVTMKAPSLSEFREGIATILSADVTGATPANIASEIEQVHSESQLTLALGASVSWPGQAAKVKGAFNFDNQDIKSRYVVKYTQSYYTVDVNQPRAAADFMGPTVTLDELKLKTGDGNPPVYVSSITYGRTVVFTFESEYSAKEMGAALEFLYRGGTEVSGDVSVKYRDIISKSRISFFILGGSGGEAAGAIDGYEKLVEFLKKGGNYSKDSPGAPIAYKLAYLKDNAPARLSFTYDFLVRDCVRVNQKVQIVLKSIYVETASDAGDDLEVYGTVYAWGSGDDVYLFDKTSAQFIKLRGGETFPAQGIISEVVVDVDPIAGAHINLNADLYDYDPTSANDVLGYESSDLPFELGWRKDMQLLFTGSSSRVWLNLHLEPI